MVPSHDYLPRGNRLLMVVLFLLPLWFPFVFLALLILEVRITKHGPLNEFGIFALWGTPAIGALSIVFARSIPSLLKVLLVPVYYFLGLLAAGMIGWIVGCWWGVVGCH